eukprot:13664983-Alexandrium_andersonii.AAC.1
MARRQCLGNIQTTQVQVHRKDRDGHVDRDAWWYVSSKVVLGWWGGILDRPVYAGVAIRLCPAYGPLRVLSL